MNIVTEFFTNRFNLSSNADLVGSMTLPGEVCCPSLVSSRVRANRWLSHKPLFDGKRAD